MQADKIYVIRTIKVNESTEDYYKKDFEKLQIDYKFWKEITFEEYMARKDMTDIRNHFNSVSEINAYFLDFEEAQEAVLNNRAGIDDHYFTYAVIQELPLGKMYAFLNITNAFFFEFNHKADKFEYRRLGEDDLSKYLQKEYGTESIYI